MFSYDKHTMDLAGLRKVPVGTPPRGSLKIWQGLQHGKLVDAVMDHGRDHHAMVYDRAGVRVWATDDGGDAAVSVPVGSGREFDKRGLVLHLGLVASNRQTEVLTAFCGAVGADGLLFVNAKLSRNKDAQWMYTVHFDLDYACETIWKWWKRQVPTVLTDYDRLAAAEASVGRVNNILMAVGRKEILPWSRVGQADKAFRVRQGKTLLDLYGAVSLPMGMSNAKDQLKNGWRLNSLLCHAASKKSKETV
jgi:hypothetical protein